MIGKKITAELIQHSPQFSNPLNQRQLDLRGEKIAAIQNMGATLNFFQCINLSDNQIRNLGNFSFLDKLTSLLLSNNRIKTIGNDLEQVLPNLQNLFMMNNKITDITEIFKLSVCKKLQRLNLVNNIVTQQPNYRLQVIAHIPSLRILDFKKITKKEKQTAKLLINTK